MSWSTEPAPRPAVRSCRFGAAALIVFAGVALGVRSVGATTPTLAAAASPVTVEARVEPGSTTIGTPIRYILRVTAEPGVEPIVPQLAASIGDFQVVDFGAGTPHQAGGREVIERWYELVTYRTGELTVPGPTVQFRTADGGIDWEAAPDVTVKVESLFAAAGATPPADVREIRAPVAVPRDYRPIFWIGGGLLGGAALGLALYWLLNRRRRALAVPPRPAHLVALEALARLQAAGLLAAARREEFYVRLSAIVREYLEGRFHVRAPEMTTEEFLQVAQRDRQLSPPQRALLGAFLTEADLVKFARYVPADADAERAYRAAREFVESTVPREVAGAAA